MANPNINQFGMNIIKGAMDLKVSAGTVISCQIDVSADVAGLVPGQPVLCVDSAGGIPKVKEVAAITNDVFGFIVYDVRSVLFLRGDQCEVAIYRNGVMYMEASAAIARNAQVMLVLPGVKVVTAGTTGNRIVGRALDKATANGDIIRVMIDLPGATVP